MDAVLLSRIQFGLTAGFHFIFPPLTIGLTLVLLIVELFHVRTGERLYLKMSTFLVKILGLVFVMGVATGIVLEFSFGTNWSNYSRLVGDIFGAPLAAEGIMAFFLESVFLGIIIFGRNRVSPRFYLLSVFLVFLGSNLSGLWIIIANSWMQTPAGYVMAGKRAVLTNFLEAALNGSTVVRYAHTIIGGWITGSLFTAGIAAWYLLKNRDQNLARPLLAISLWIFAAASLAQFGAGHAHSVQVAHTQPEKMATFEALWETRAGAPMSIIGFPDPVERKTRFEISIPKLLSIGIHFDPDAEVTGLNEFEEKDLPPLLATYFSYHTMIGLGTLFFLMSLLALLLAAFKKIHGSRWFLALLVAAIPLPFISNMVGWMSAEIGRQPWAVYHVLRTADAASVVVPAGQILFTIIMFSMIYILLFTVFIKLLSGIIRKGPEHATTGYLGE